MVKPLRLALVGFGKLGRACADMISPCHDLGVVAIVRRPASAGEKLPDRFQRVPVFTHPGQLKDMDGALICVPTNHATESAIELLRQGIPIVDCATFHGEALQAHKHRIRKVALQRKVPAVVAAGWDPGALSVFRSWFVLLTPGGTTRTTHRPGVTLHHTAMARTVSGVKDALCAEVRADDGRLRRYVYVELEPGAKIEPVTEAIRADPLFLGEDTQVFPVESLVGFEQEGRGVVLERRGPPGPVGHHHFLLEARFDETILAARAMLAAARALRNLEPGAYALADLPLGALWGEEAEREEHDWP